MKINSRCVNYSLFLKEWKEAKRKLLPITIGIIIFSLFTILMMYALPSLVHDIPAELFPELTPTILSQTFFSNANNILSIIAVILCVDAIAGEREKNTLTLIKTAPIRDSFLITIKTIVRFLLVAIPSFISSLAVYFLIMLMSGRADFSNYLLASVFLLFTLFLYVSVGILISTFTKSQLSSGAISVLIVFSLTLISSLLNQGKTISYNFLQISVNVLSYSFSNIEIIVNILLILGFSILLLFLSVVIISSEREPTRK
ncbi:MAG: ABC transporter permease [Candidatus Heimdallarchaeum aukensis]|uniref:ABC transporter permease n=1 Tax=Candidatus Heimdallarchaeum aukensis TaxID=2876573 RepID=A0A9Y1BMM9_9ARCH|nr:MAG: ABC transporter permease [Candidatus Heimdallarchaeum aukensis]